MPFFYLFFTLAFFLWVSFTVGHFPSYGNPDPKNYAVLFLIENCLLIFVPISFLVWIVLGVRAFLYSTWKQEKNVFLIGILGFFLIALVMKFNPMQFLDWLAD